MATMRNRFATRMLNLHRLVKSNLVAGLLRRRGHRPLDAPPPRIRVLIDGNEATVVDVDRLLLKPSSPSSATALFPPFFLLAVEAGGFVRGLVLLALYPALRLLTAEGARLKAMAMVCFLGLRRGEAARAGRAVLPRYFFREAADVEALMEAAASARKEVITVVAAASRLFPTVMVETFLKEYVGFDAVVGRETPRNGAGPRPLIFHDGRLAFTPTPAAALAMYVYLPLAVALSVLRIAIFTLLPRGVSGAAAALAGVRLRVAGAPRPPAAGDAAGGRLYACNHRTLLDAVAVSGALGRPVSSVTYSLGRLSELLSPIPLLPLAREREEDRRRMASLLSRGDVVVCPEGTTCREPYLLRFSPLFAELADEVNPVAVRAAAGMFYGTSTSPSAKCFDSVFFLMNPSPEYGVHFLEPVATAGAGAGSSIEVANRVQRVIAGALGYEATTLTRKAKYLLLAGNEGGVATNRSNNK
uniref:Phospholipid/glycerol acyltransferase domain-containing protein n=1 Tax=Oryza sativa subsp. japonica TaxID=39947 RepID=Q8SBA0_ORYSJ|nr:hypothetical protein [Oryza sativa Japonica Group]